MSNKNKRGAKPSIPNPVADQCTDGWRYHPTKGWKKVFGDISRNDVKKRGANWWLNRFHTHSRIRSYRELQEEALCDFITTGFSELVKKEGGN